MTTVICAVSIVLMVAWLPGLIMGQIVSEGQDWIARISSSYASSQSVFSHGIRYAFRSCINLPLRSASGLAVHMALFLATAIIIGDISAVLIDPDTWILSLTMGMILSVGGFFVIGIRPIRDFIRERWIRRQLL